MILLIASVILIFIGCLNLYNLGFENGQKHEASLKKYKEKNKALSIEDLNYFNTKLEATTDPEKRKRLEKMIKLIEESIICHHLMVDAISWSLEEKSE
jgi:hypothetical protein